MTDISENKQPVLTPFLDWIEINGVLIKHPAILFESAENDGGFDSAMLCHDVRCESRESQSITRGNSP